MAQQSRHAQSSQIVLGNNGCWESYSVRGSNLDLDPKILELRLMQGSLDEGPDDQGFCDLRLDRAKFATSDEEASVSRSYYTGESRS